MINLIETPDRKLELFNAQAARIISIGTSWTKIRIMGRFTWTNVPQNPGAVLFYLGLLSNPGANAANGPLMATTSHFVGMRTSSTITRNAGPPVHYTGASLFPVIKVGTTTSGPSGLATQILSGGIRGVYGVDIEKGSPNYTFSTLLPTTSTAIANVAIDIPYEILIGAMEAGPTAADARIFLNGFTGFSSYTNSGGTAAVDEAVNGSLNSVCVAWNRAYLSCKCSELVWSRIT